MWLSANTDVQRAPDALQLRGGDSSSSQFPTGVIRGGTERAIFYETFANKSSSELLLLTVEAWTVGKNGPTEMNRGAFRFLTHLCNTWSLTLCCLQAGYIIASLLKTNRFRRTKQKIPQCGNYHYHKPLFHSLS